MFKVLVSALTAALVLVALIGMVSAPQASPAAHVDGNTTVIEKNIAYPLRADLIVARCEVSLCADI